MAARKATNIRQAEDRIRALLRLVEASEKGITDLAEKARSAAVANNIAAKGKATKKVGSWFLGSCGPGLRIIRIAHWLNTNPWRRVASHRF
jgi:hypothetical protein